MNIKFILIFIVMLILIGLGGLFIVNNKSNQPTKILNSTEKLIVVNEFTHGHGLAVDVNDPNNVYIATHHGLYLLKNDKDLFQVGESRDDYMGFSTHPTDSNIFYSSGHPEAGGNIGFQKSIDGGFTWEKLSDGVNGPVDFHALTVSPVNPDFIFGWYQGGIQGSDDGGKSWKAAGNTNFVVVGLAADSENDNIIYATSPQGLYKSENNGEAWSQLLNGFVSVVAINPIDSKNLLSYSEKNGLARSNDSGGSWEKINENFNGEIPLFIDFNRQGPDTVYLLTEKNSIYKSTDSGNNWLKVR